MITIWTDGSCQYNPGPGGWCAVIAMHEGASEQDIAMMAEIEHGLGLHEANPVITYVGPGQIARTKILVGSDPETTNNRMEMTAIIEAIESFNRHAEVTIISDSKYAIQVLSGMWKARQNRDLLARWLRSSDGFKITWRHVPGHSGYPVNELCDRLAKEAVSGES